MGLLLPQSPVTLMSFQAVFIKAMCQRLSVIASCFDGLVLVIKGKHTFPPPLDRHIEDSVIGANTGTSGVHLTMHRCIVNLKLLFALINA